MPNELFICIVVVIIAGLLSSFLSLYAQFKLRNVPGAKPYILVTFCSAIFTFSYACELASTTLVQMKFWLNIEYLVMPWIPVFILFMCLEYVGHRLKQWMYYGLFAVPIFTIFMHGTNELHHLFYTSLQINPESPIPVLKLEHGPLFYVHSIFLFFCVMISIITLLKELTKTRLFRFRMQIFLMVAGITLPIIANYFYINGLNPYGIDLGPVSMSVSFILHGAALVTYQMFHVTPVARDTVFENMNDGVIVLNQNGLIIDYNQAMMTIIPTLSSQSIGKSIVDIVEGNRPLIEMISLEQAGDYQYSLNGENIYYHIRFSTVIKKHSNMKIITFADVTERVSLQEKMKILASIDGLTQVYNRHFFMQECERVVDSFMVDDRNVSMIMFDIDHFKNVNDTFGHEAGDRVLTHVSSVVKESIRSTDMIGRYGGEEFMICLPDTSLMDAYELAQSIRMNILQTVIPYLGNEIRITSSFGISSALIRKGDTNQTVQILLREADQALYEAKRKGRNYVELYEKHREA